MVAFLGRPWETRALLLSHRTRRDKNAADGRPGGIGSQWVHLTRHSEPGTGLQDAGADDAHTIITKTYSV